MEEVDINRSTFYLHYTDIYQMLESIEAELMEEITHLVADYPLDPLNNKESSYPFIEQIFTILDHAFCLNGCVGMIKTWLSSENQESTQHMAELTHKLIDNTTHMYLEQALR